MGNFTPEEAISFFRHVRRIVGAEGGLLLGLDLRKDKARLEAAYDDNAGVTAAFSLNLLTRINRELGADFDLNNFRHEANWNPDASRVEIFIRSLREQTVNVAGRPFRFGEGEGIHSENAYKHTLESLEDLALVAGLRVQMSGWTTTSCSASSG